MIELYIGTKAEKYLNGELTTTQAPTTPSTTTSTTTLEVSEEPTEAPSDTTTQDAVE